MNRILLYERPYTKEPVICMRRASNFLLILALLYQCRDARAYRFRIRNGKANIFVIVLRKVLDTARKRRKKENFSFCMESEHLLNKVHRINSRG
ncbi:MAG: hypothetical protein DRO11_05255 [Methanobacteriota archaeon]|nr:MAG: hypothetical protein DRO11_05255 [Euryarchaeota archaeon]